MQPGYPNQDPQQPYGQQPGQPYGQQPYGQDAHGVQQAQYGQPYGQQPQIDNNMTMSIVSIFLFWPLAIPAIINASKVNTLLAVGDYGGAQSAAADSKKWSKLALIIGLSLWALNVVCCGIWLVASAASTTSGY